LKTSRGEFVGQIFRQRNLPLRLFCFWFLQIPPSTFPIKVAGNFQQLIWNKRLPVQKIGRDYVIEESDLKLVENRKPGRPSKD